MFASVAVDVEVGQFDRFTEPMGKPVFGDVPIAAPCIHHVLVDLGCCHLAGDLAGGGTTHPVGDEIEEATFPDFVLLTLRRAERVPAGEIGNEEGVLVVVARPTAIGDGVDGGTKSRRGDRSG
jgi:hypothetical protein